MGELSAILAIFCINVIYAYGVYLPAASGQLNLGAAGLQADERKPKALALIPGDRVRYLAEIAEQLNMGAYLRLSTGEEAAGIRRNISVLADVTEAVIGAIYKDAGLEAVRPIVERFWLALADRDVKPPKDVKTELQELVQRKGCGLPQYREISRSGPDHQPVFTVEVMVEGAAPARGQGTSKQAAERAAAEALLSSLPGPS